MSSTRKDVVVEKLVPGGQGLCRDEEGVFFVSSVAPGERVRVEVEGKRRGARQGKLLEILQASPERVVPDCALVDRCGGCDWLHLSRAAQTAGKEEIVDDALLRVGKFSAEEIKRFRRPLLVPPDGEKRRRARFVANERGRLTFSARGSHERVEISQCPALDPRISKLLERIAGIPPGTEVWLAVDDRHGVVAGVRAEAAAASVRRHVRGMAIDAGQLARTDNLGVVDDGRLTGEVTAGAVPYACSDALTFTQATRFGGGAIRDCVLRAVGDVTARRLLELFAGAGHLTFPLLGLGAHVDAVEGDRRAFLYFGETLLLQNLAHKPLPGVLRHRHAFIDEKLPFDPDTEIVVADPPRTGIPGAAKLFARMSKVTRLVLVSCDPATGARDLRAAVNAGFVVDELTPIDAFPRTHHVEWVAVLSRA